MNLRAGTYSGTLTPANSGSGISSRIVFQAYTGETVTFSGGSPSVELSGVSYIALLGFTFANTTTIDIRVEGGASHNEIGNNTFTNTAGGDGLAAWAIYMTGAQNQQWTQYNWIHNNTFTTSGQAVGSGGSGCTDGGGDLMIIGAPYGSFSNTVENDNYNTVENNVFAYSAHAEIDSYGMYNVFRNNYFHNEPWSSGCPNSGGTYNVYTYSSSNPNYSAYNGSFGHRNWQITDDYLRTGVFNLIESNRSGYAGVNQANDGADDFSLAAPQNIIRYNFTFAGMNPGLMFKYGWNSGLGAGGNGGTYNRIYNNTFYQNGYGYPWAGKGGACAQSTCPWPQSAISLYYSTTSGVGNVLKNNIFYLSAGYTNYSADVLQKGGPSNGWQYIGTALHNWCSGSQTSTDSQGNTGCSASGNPQFNNPDISNPLSTTLPDLSLQASSPAIDGGTNLTTATNSGANSTTLTVADALYFQDGTWGSDLAGASAGLGGTMQADWIAISSVTNVVQIASVSYGAYNNPAGTIKLASPMTWNSGDRIWLYKKSDGAVVLAGAAPDYGASEYTSSTKTGSTVPTNIQVTVQ